MKRYAIIVAGGKGVRLGGDIPKQFRNLSGKPVLMHTIDAFFNAGNDIKIIVVLPSNHKDYWDTLCCKYKFTTVHTVVIGGDTRWRSVKNGLSLVTEDSLVAVHDGVRPLISANLIDAAFIAAEKHGSAIPVIEATDSLRLLDSSGKSKSVDRSVYRAVQTPQVFRSGILTTAYNTPYSESFTDDATVVEAASEKITLIEGEHKNIKITTPEDLIFAEILIKGA
ncbi:MAG: 2-C-methyl-D-erythritol 4-phosphate cytidylyltransferase [Bacteroidales bacterium]